jgi:regulatory protein YycH of two-component signal transduction system YycFG
MRGEQMSDTMIAMDLIHADNLKADQLMIGDLIKINDDIVEVIFIESDSTGDNYDIQTENEFGEKEIVQFAYTDLIPLYVFIEEEE